MAHNPVNHPLRPMYRVVGFLAGAYLVAFGIVSMIQTSGEEFIGHNGVRALGQGSTMLWSIIALALGAIVLIATAVGRNVDTNVDKLIGWGILIPGTYSLAFIRTDANFLGFTISTVIATYLVGLALITTSLYSKVAPAAQAGAPRQVREGRTA